MGKSTESATERILRNIQLQLGDMKDERTVTDAVLARLEASIHRLDVTMFSVTAELRAIRSQFDRWRNDTNERLNNLESE